MGSRKSNGRLLDRIDAVGWEYRPTKSGRVLVKNDKGDTFSVLDTRTRDYGDNRAMLNDLKTAERHGLSDAESRVERRLARDRDARLKAGSVVTNVPKTQDVDVSNDVTPNDEDTKDEETNVAGKIDMINGLRVVARDRARVETPITNGQAVPIKSVDEVLLEDGSTVFQCVKVPDECSKYFDNAISARSHGVAHRDKSKTTARPARPTKTAKTTDDGGVKEFVRKSPVRKKTDHYDELVNKLDSMETRVNYLAVSVSSLEEDLHDLIDEVRSTVDRARRYDGLRSMLDAD